MSKAEKATASIAGRVFDESGRTVGGAKVRCDEEETMTLFDGSYVFTNLSPGSHNVFVDVEGYNKAEKSLHIGDGSSTTADFELEPETGNAKVHGYVVDASTGENFTKGGHVYMLRPTYNKKTTIDPRTGYYEFANLPPGRYTLWTSILEYRDERKTTEVTKGEARREDFHVKKREDIEPPWG